MAENKAACVSYLIIKEFTKILHIHLVFLSVNNCCKAVEHNVMRINILYCANYVAELSDTGRLNEDTVGSVVCKNFFKSLAKVSDKAAANAAGVHFSDLNACVLKESAVNSYLSEFIFDKHKLFALIALSDELLYKCSLSGTEKSRKKL